MDRVRLDPVPERNAMGKSGKVRFTVNRYIDGTNVEEEGTHDIDYAVTVLRSAINAARTCADPRTEEPNKVVLTATLE